MSNLTPEQLGQAAVASPRLRALPANTPPQSVLLRIGRKDNPFVTKFGLLFTAAR